MESQQLSADTLLSTNEYSVEVTFCGDNLDPDALDAILPIEATKKGRKGEPHSHGKEGTCDSGFWSHEISSRDDITECRDHQLNRLVDAIEPHREALGAAGVDRIWFYYTLASSIGLMNIRLRPDTMKRLAAIDADLYISCFDCFDPDHDFWKVDAASSSEGNGQG